MTTVRSRKAKLIEAAAGQFTLMIDRVEPTARYVSVEGPVSGTRPATEELIREISARYLPAQVVPGYVEYAKAEHGEQIIYSPCSERWLSADVGSG
jgi:hypothetical protein